MRLPPLLLFDMDGVLADVAHSYRAAILATAHCYLSDVLGAALPPSGLWTAAHVDALKRAGGFNNDWDAAAALAALALTGVTAAKPPSLFARDPGFDAALDAVQGALAGVELRPVLEDEFAAVCARIAAAGGGPAGLRAAAGGGAAELVAHRGAVTGGDLITRIFQERYLGGDTFTEVYGAAPHFAAGPGLAERETLLVPAALLWELAGRSRLGIATGRPRQEAVLFLRRHRIAGAFGALVTEDEIAAAEMAGEGRVTRGMLRKPHPWSLLTALGLLGAGEAAYFGDTPDDLRAARAASAVRPVLAAGCLWGCPDPEAARAAMLQAGADLLLEQPEEIAGWAP